MKGLSHLQYLIIVLLQLNYYGNKAGVKFTGSCLKQSNISYNHGKVVNIYIAYELGASSSHNNDPTLKNCLYGAVTLTKNPDIDKCGYSGYGIGFDQVFHFQVVDLVKIINFRSGYEFFCTYW